MPTTANATGVTSNTVVQTLLQLQTPATRAFQIAAWGFSMFSPPGADAHIELIDTAAIAATVTAHTSTGIIKLDPNANDSLAALGAAATGFTATAEGAIVATRLFDTVKLSSTSAEWTNPYEKEWPWHRMPNLAASRNLRVRCTTPTTGVLFATWIDWIE
jgi:hypothetical protein